MVSAHLVTLNEEKSTALIQHVLGVPEKVRTHIEILEQVLLKFVCNRENSREKNIGQSSPRRNISYFEVSGSWNSCTE